MDISGVFQGLASLFWILFIAVIGLAIFRSYRGRPMKGVSTLLIAIGILALLMTTLGAGVRTIEPEERGVVISYLSPKGYREQALQPGMHWIIPFFERVEVYEVSKQNFTMSINPEEGTVQGEDSVAARTEDGQEIYVDASVIYSIDPEQVIDVHILWQDRYIVELVRPQARGIIRDAVSQYKVEEIVSTKRFDLQDDIRSTLARKFADNGLILSDFVLRNITFSEEYAASVEQKQIAEQQALQAAFVVEQKKQEAQQVIETAKGEAEAAKIRAEGQAQARVIQAQAEAEALDLIAGALEENPDLLTYQYIDKLAPGIEVMLVPNNTPFMLPLPEIGPEAPVTNMPATTP